MKRLLILLVILGVVLVFSPTVYSASSGVASAELYINAIVTPFCSVEVDSLEFGEYDGSNKPRGDYGGRIRVDCTKNTEFTVKLTDGDWFFDNWRRMRNTESVISPYQYLKYRLWFEDGPGVGTFTRWRNNNSPPGLPTDGSQVELTVWGRVPGVANQPDGVMPVGGEYQDLVQVIVDYELL